jgi:hypothetical protein
LGIALCSSASKLAKQPPPVKASLAEVVETADTVQIAVLRKDALAAVNELKTKGSDNRRNLDFWGQVSVGAVALRLGGGAGTGGDRHSLRDWRLCLARTALVLGKATVMPARTWPSAWGLLQSCATETFKIMLAIGVQLPG